MKNYIKIGGHKIKLSDETVKNIKETFLKEEDKYFDLSELRPYPFDAEKLLEAGFHSDQVLGIKAKGKYGYKSFYLSPYCHWEIVEDDLGDLILLPTKR